jgi:hypothetical protein
MDIRGCKSVFFPGKGELHRKMAVPAGKRLYRQTKELIPGKWLYRRERVFTAITADKIPASCSKWQQRARTGGRDSVW